MALKIWLDGKLVDESEAKISVFDHGLLYGDGIFEGIRFYNGRVFRLEDHLKRLFASARAIMMSIPWSQQDLQQALIETIRANGLTDGYVRLVITRGVGSLGMNPFQCETPSLFIIAAQIELYAQEHYEKGLDLITCATRRPTPGSLSPQIKSLNYLNNVMAKIEAIQAGTIEALMLNEQGTVAECSGDNIFIVKDGKVITPPVSDGSLDGITRQVIFELCEQEGLDFQEKTLVRYDIYTADECFLTGTAAEVIPVVRLDQRPIGEGEPGIITNRLIKAYRNLTTTGTPI